MNMLVDGEWTRDAYESTNDDGEFERSETTFRSYVEGVSPDLRGWGDPDAPASFPAEAGRYHLYISRACPWAHRTALVRRLMGVEDVVSLSVVEPERYDEGWEFSEECPDPIHGFDRLYETYAHADPDYTGRVTVPVLYDPEEETVVNNESAEIMRMLDVGFHDLGNGVDLYPAGLRDEVDDLIDEMYEPVNNGVYRAGFADSQAAYDEAVDELFATLDRFEELLGERRYLAGDRLTEADLALFPTLVRFDHVYHTHFKCNRRAVHEYPNLWNYTKELYGLPGVAETVNLDHVTRHYYKSHGDVNPKRLVPTGPDIDFGAPHNRDRLAGGPPEPLAEDAAPADD